jgi:hypothetical protein
LLALRLSGNKSGALLACVVAVLGGAITTKLEWTNLVVAYGWMPWVLLPLARTPRPTRMGLVAAATFWGIQALAGHPNTWLFTGLAAVVLLFAIAPRAATVARAAGFILLGAAIGAVQLIPTALLTTLSVRSTGLSADDLFTSAATGFDPLGFAFSNVFVKGGGLGWDTATTWYPDGVFAMLEAGAYVGLTVLALAAVGMWARRARPWLAVAAVMIAIPVVAAFRPAVWQSIPILDGLRSPVRTYLVLDLVLGLLAAIGISRLHRARGAWRPAALVVGGLAALYGATLVLAETAPEIFDALQRAFSSNLDQAGAEAGRLRAIAALTEPLPVLVELAFGVLALAAIALRRPRRTVTAALVVLGSFPLLLFSPQANLVQTEPAFSSAGSDFVQALEKAGAHRVVTINRPGWYEGMPDQLAAAGVPDLEMFSSLNLLASDELLNQARNAADAESLRRAAGVDVVVTFGRPCPGRQIATVPGPKASICRTDDALRPPYWIPLSAASVVESGGGSLPSAISEATHPNEAVLDISAVLQQARSEEVTTWGPNGDEIVVDAPADGYVWVDRSWWPGWETSLDGRRVEVLEAMGGQLVPVPAGHHVLRQELVPWDALLGVDVGLVGAALALLWLALGWRSGNDPGPKRARQATRGASGQ